MADITVTPASVVPGAGASIDRRYNFGATVLAGQGVYLDTADNKWKLADANASAALAALGGVALHGGADGQPAAVLTGGDYNPGATVVVGTIYVASATPGGIAPSADGVTGWFTSILGVATAANNIRVDIQVSGVAKP
jgi:hypothetical protein